MNEREFQYSLELDTRRRIRAKDPFVQQIILMLATKRSVEAGAPSSDDTHLKYARAALEEWECEIAPALRAAAPGVSESDLAETLIERTRQDPDNTWSKILRKGTN